MKQERRAPSLPSNIHSEGVTCLDSQREHSLPSQQGTDRLSQPNATKATQQGATNTQSKRTAAARKSQLQPTAANNSSNNINVRSISPPLAC